MAIALNVVLVEKYQLRPPLAYGVVLAVQVSVNFVFVRRFVFARHAAEKSWLMQYVQFTSGILGFRIVDWGLYALIVQTTTIHYLVVQAANVVVFGIAKFLFSQRVMEGNGKNVESGRKGGK